MVRDSEKYQLKRARSGPQQAETTTSGASDDDDGEDNDGEDDEEEDEIDDQMEQSPAKNFSSASLPPGLDRLRSSSASMAHPWYANAPLSNLPPKSTNAHL